VATQVDGARRDVDVHQVVHDAALDVVLDPVHQVPAAHVEDLDVGKVSVCGGGGASGGRGWDGGIRCDTMDLGSLMYAYLECGNTTGMQKMVEKVPNNHEVFLGFLFLKL